MRSLKDFLQGSIMAAVLILFMMWADNSNATLFCDSDNNPGPPVTWNKGQPTDAIHALSFDTGVSCFAVGAELDFILTHFNGIHTRQNAGFMNWYGDDAQFIVGNL